MIKAMDNIDGDASDTSKSNRSKSARGSDDDDDNASCRSEGNGTPANNDYDQYKSRKSSVISMNMFNSKGGLRESTPKNYHKNTDN